MSRAAWGWCWPWKGLSWELRERTFVALIGGGEFGGPEGFDFKELQRRAEEQIERIEAERIRAAQPCSPIGRARIDGRYADPRKNGQETKANGGFLS